VHELTLNLFELTLNLRFILICFVLMIGCWLCDFGSESLAIFIGHMFACPSLIFLLKRATMSSAKAVTKQLLASQIFLIGLRSLMSTMMMSRMKIRKS